MAGSKAALVRSREQLAQRVVSAVGSIATKLTELEADLRQLWTEFENLSDGETILGCSTKKEFCEMKLHRTPRAVQYLLKGGNAANMAQRRENISLPPAPEPEPTQAKVHPDSKRFGDALKKAVAADRKRNDSTAEPSTEAAQIAEPAQLEITEDEARAIFANKNGEVLSEKTSPGNRNYYYITFERGGRFWRFNVFCSRGYKPQPEGLNRIKRDDVVSIVCAEVFPVIVTEYRTRKELEESGETVAASAPTPEPAVVELKEGTRVRIKGQVYKLRDERFLTIFDENGNINGDRAFIEPDHIEIYGDMVRSTTEMEKRTIAKFVEMSQKFPVFKTKVSQNGEGVITVWGEGFSSPPRTIDGHHVSDDEVGEGVPSFEEGEKLRKKIDTAIQKDKKKSKPAPVAAPKRKGKKARK